MATMMSDFYNSSYEGRLISDCLESVSRDEVASYLSYIGVVALLALVGIAAGSYDVGRHGDNGLFVALRFSRSANCVLCYCRFLS